MGDVIYKPWLLYPHIWKTESAWLSFIRGGIRCHLWSKNPVKLEFMKDCRKMIVNPNVKGRKARPKVWGGVCEICSGEFPLKEMEVDHRTGEYSLRCVEDIQKFVEGIVFVRKEDLAHLCKSCHKAKTYSQRTGMSMEDAIIEKEAIAICKKPAAEVKQWIIDHGQTPERTVAERRVQVVLILKILKER